MDTVKFNNEANQIAIQASQYNAYGKTIVQHQADALDRLPYAAEAAFDTYAKQHESHCLSGTRVDILKDIQGWVKEQDTQCIFWLHGHAGTGKSTIARTIAGKYKQEGELVASFFFTRGGGDVSHARKFVTTIARQLARNIPVLKQHIRDAVVERDEIAGQGLCEQWNLLVLHPLSMLQEPGPYVLVIDAVDECNDDADVQTIIQLLAEAQKLEKVRLRVLLTSRPEESIRASFKRLTHAEHREFILHSVPLSLVNHDIKILFESKLRSVYPKVVWPGADIILQLVNSASGLFIWASTACRFILEGRQFLAKTRLAAVLRKDRVYITTPATPEKQLDEIYLTVLQNTISNDYSAEEQEAWCKTLKSVLGSLVTLYCQLSLAALSELLEYEMEEVEHALESLHSIICIQNDSQTLRLHHPSFRDFLIDQRRCTDSKFWICQHTVHRELASQCLKLMCSTKGLRHDICNLSNPGVLRSEIDDIRIAAHISAELQYACRYWVDHLERGGCGIVDGDDTYKFIHEHFLHWLEVMSLIDEISQCVRLVARLRALVKRSNDASIALLYDADRLLLRFASILVEAPLQIYSSALLFAPDKSLLRQIHAKTVSQPVEILSEGNGDWGVYRSVLNLHSAGPNALTFSSDGQLIALASMAHIVRVWETMTGHCCKVLVGHSLEILAVAFSPDGKLLASSSRDGTVRLWEVATGQCCSTLVFDGTIQSPTSVSFSADSRLLFSMSKDLTVRIWDSVTGICQERLVFEGSADSHTASTFSSDSQLVAVASRSLDIWILDVVKRTSHSFPTADANFIYSVSFSSDKTLLASASHDGTIRVWSLSGELRYTLKGHTNSVRGVTFLQDSHEIASASYDNTVRIWDVASESCCCLLEGHTAWVNSVAYSPVNRLIASASYDGTIRLWEADSRTPHVKPPNNTVQVVAISPDKLLVVTGTRDGALQLWEIASGSCLSILQGHTKHVSALTFSTNSRYIASGSYDQTVRVWDVASTTCHRTLRGHDRVILSVACSAEMVPYGGLVVSGSWDHTVRVWDIASGSCLNIFRGHTSEIWSVALSSERNLIASACGNNTIRLWTIATEASIVMSGHTGYIRALNFSQDSQWLASISDDETARVWDVKTGSCLRSLIISEVDFWAKSVDFSPDGSHLRTTRGQIPIHPPLIGSCIDQAPRSHHVSLRDQWIFKDEQRVFFVPVEHCSYLFAIRGNIICFGLQWGGILLIRVR